MEERPPVPPKDLKYTSRMDVDRPSTAPSSGSKRKRESHDESFRAVGDGELEAANPDTHSPKRARSNHVQSDISASEDETSTKPRLVRRKKGSRNLSNLNLHHAAQQHASPPAQPRESRFQEGSLSDRPSEQPPSVFTRVIRTESGNLQHVEDLMESYQAGMPTPRESFEEKIRHEKEMIPQRVAAINAEKIKKEEGRGFFQFGRQLASNFHPVTLWNKMWYETKDELTRRDLEEAERKAQQKVDAEKRYAILKDSGQLALKPVGKLANGHPPTSDEVATPRDSAVVIDSGNSSFEQRRSISAVSQLLQPPKDDNSRSGSEIPEPASRPSKTLRSRLHVKTPSLSNMKDGLKRVSSDFNLAAAARLRESSSISPTKLDFDNPNSALKKSASKHDLKKQHKLSKRVSDLETKLQLARRDLDTALEEASPMPKLGSKYERFTPYSMSKRPKFMPGKLPSLPSERILMAEQMESEREREGNSNGLHVTNGLPRDDGNMSLKEFLAERERSELDDSIKTRDNRPYPNRASSLFFDNNNNKDSEELPLAHAQTTQNDNFDEITQQNKHPSNEIENMDPNSIIDTTTNGATEPVKPADYSSLDAKLKALEENVKVARNAGKPKKRKPTTKKDVTLKPVGIESDDEFEFETTPKKKQRKSTVVKSNSSPPNKRSAAARKQTSPKGKKGGAATKTQGVIENGIEEIGEKIIAAKQSSSDQEMAEAEDEYSADDAAEEVRTSLDSQTRPLDPVYEEEEEGITTTTVTMAVNGEASKPIAKATPARFGRSRSRSPNKLAKANAGAEEQMMTRAAFAAHRNRSVSPPPSAYTKTTIVEETETVTIRPGEEGVPKLPRGATGSVESLPEVLEDVMEEDGEEGRGFEWPEDVF